MNTIQDARTRETAHAFVREVMRTGFLLIDVLGPLVDELGDDAFPGEDPAAVVLEMVAGSFIPACEAAGAETVKAGTALVGALADRTVDDLREAARLASERGGPGTAT